MQQIEESTKINRSIECAEFHQLMKSRYVNQLYPFQFYDHRFKNVVKLINGIYIIGQSKNKEDNPY